MPSKLSIVIALLLVCNSQAWRQPGDTRPNFVIFFPDETRAESIGCYGHPFVHTPNLDRFATQGTRFDQAHVLHTQCAPSRCAITTGRYMHVLGHRTQTHLVQNYEPNMFRYLKQANYTVLWYGKNDMLSADSFNSSVTDWKGLIGVTQGGNAFTFGEAGYYSFLSTPSNTYGNSTKNGDYHAVTTTLDFIRNDPPEPFMVFLPGIGSHPPYGAPKDYYSKYSAEEVSEKSPLRPPNLPNKPKYHTGIIKYRNLTSFNQSFFDKINAIYLGRVSYVDWVFGQLVEGIDASSVGNRTAIFMSSDHGDFAGDFHLVEKWPGGVDDILTRVPMLVRIPGGTKSHVVKEPINSFDMMATILEMADVEIKHVHFARSFLDQLHGEEGNSSRTVYSEGGFLYHNEIEPYDPKQQQLNDPKNLYYARAQEEIHEGSPRVVMARNMDYKLAYRPAGVSELYDLKKDPRELSNVYMDKDYADVRDQMESDLLCWMVETGDVTPLVEDNRGLPPPPH